MRFCSFPFLLRTSYCSGVSCFFYSSSVLLTITLNHREHQTCDEHRFRSEKTILLYYHTPPLLAIPNNIIKYSSFRLLFFDNTFDGIPLLFEMAMLVLFQLQFFFH